MNDTVQQLVDYFINIGLPLYPNEINNIRANLDKEYGNPDAYGDEVFFIARPSNIPVVDVSSLNIAGFTCTNIFKIRVNDLNTYYELPYLVESEIWDQSLSVRNYEPHPQLKNRWFNNWRHPKESTESLIYAKITELHKMSFASLWNLQNPEIPYDTNPDCQIYVFATENGQKEYLEHINFINNRFNKLVINLIN